MSKMRWRPGTPLGELTTLPRPPVGWGGGDQSATPFGASIVAPSVLSFCGPVCKIPATSLRKLPIFPSFNNYTVSHVPHHVANLWQSGNVRPMNFVKCLEVISEKNLLHFGVICISVSVFNIFSFRWRRASYVW